MSRGRKLRAWLGDRPLPAWILAVLALQTCAAAAVWLAGIFTGEHRWAAECAGYIGAFFLIGTAVAETGAAAFVLLHFENGEAMRPAWLVLLLAGCARLAGVLMIELGATPPQSAGNPGIAASLRELGLLAGGPLQMAFLGLGLAFALRVYRRAGLAGQLGRFDRFTFLVGVLFAAQLSLLWPAWNGAAASATGLITRINFSSGPLLSLLLLESLLLRRSAARLHGGLIGECWSAYAAATFLSILADVGGWAAVHGQLPAAFGAVSRFLAYPAAAAYALGPALQATAILRVRQRSAIRSLAAGVAPLTR